MREALQKFRGQIIHIINKGSIAARKFFVPQCNDDVWREFEFSGGGGVSDVGVVLR